VRDRVRVETHRANRGQRADVIGGVDRVRQEELSLALGRVDFDGNKKGRSDQYPTLARLGNDEGSLFNTIVTAKRCRNDDRPTFANAARLSGDGLPRGRFGLRRVYALRFHFFGPRHPRFPRPEESDFARFSENRALPVY
jgi:hypothetical protein